jgi:hypothetical protein
MAEMVALQPPPPTDAEEDVVSLGSEPEEEEDDYLEDPISLDELREGFKGLYAPRTGEKIDERTGNVISQSVPGSFAAQQQECMKGSLEQQLGPCKDYPVDNRTGSRNKEAMPVVSLAEQMDVDPGTDQSPVPNMQGLLEHAEAWGRLQDRV